MPAASAPPAADGSHAVAKLLALSEGLYALTAVGSAPSSGAAPGLAVPAIHISAPPHSAGAVEITDSAGRPAAWLGAGYSTVLVKSPPGGALALVTAYPARDPEHPPLSLEIRRLDDGGAGIGQAGPTTVFLADPIATPAGPEEIRLEIVAHLRQRGDVRFIDRPWAGRLGGGLWIESFTIVPRHRLAAAAIEYKALTATGAETPWVGSGSPCGTRGLNTPLIGFAVRQKASPGDALFDCEYSGYFQSGATVGPCRNGAPCLSATANDPLEGIQLRVIVRPKRSNPPPAGPSTEE